MKKKERGIFCFGATVILEDHIEKIARKFGIGRDTHVGDTIIGIKGRVGFEAAAPILIIKAHHLLEKHIREAATELWLGAKIRL